jgi:hypothetical protein
MPVTRIRFIDARFEEKRSGWIRNSSEFRSALAAMREKSIAPHEVLEVTMPKPHDEIKTAGLNFAQQLNKFAGSEKLPYKAIHVKGRVCICCLADLA